MVQGKVKRPTAWGALVLAGHACHARLPIRAIQATIGILCRSRSPSGSHSIQHGTAPDWTGTSYL